jgi:hypothetical protein
MNNTMNLVAILVKSSIGNAFDSVCTTLRAAVFLAGCPADQA